MSSESEAEVKGGEAVQQLSSLGKYVIERKLGQGGMGTVYLAKNIDLKKAIALKVLPQDKAKNPILVKRFKSEAQAAAKLEHPNIVAVYDSGEADGYLYIAMEFVDGIDLFEQVKRRGVVPVKRSIEIIKQVTSALQHAYEQNIVHRDIKPSNLLVRRDGTIKLTDLGLARSIDDTLETNITRAGTTVGTVDYMAPEQARNSKLADIRSDIYSLGCTWYQMLTGEPPFPQGSLTNKLQAHATKPLPDPRDLNEKVPEGVIAVLQRMTAKKPEERYQSPAELLIDLTQSKLTQAEFAREIFSDLSDHEVSTSSNDDDEDDEDFDDEDWEDDEPSEKQLSPRKKSSSSDGDGSSSPSPSSPTRRKSSGATSDSDADPSARRKSRSRDVDSGIAQETQSQSSKSTKRISTKNRGEEEDFDSGTTPRSGRKSGSVSNQDDAEEPAPSKRRRSQSPDDEDRPPSSRRSKPTSSNETTEKKPAQSGPKPMPPKRSPLVEQEDESEKPSSELLKYLGAIAGAFTLISGLGFLFYKLSNGVDVVSSPPPPTQVVTTDPGGPIRRQQTQPQEQRDPTNPNTTTTEPAKPNVVAAPTEKPLDFDLSKMPFPVWATSPAAEPTDLPVFTVGPGGSSATHFANLDDALRAIVPNGAVIRLIGNGPFAISSIELKPGIKLLITAASPQDQPLVFFKPNEAGVVKGLSLDQGLLDLRGLHFIFDRPQELTTTSNKMITVNDGQLFVRNCSITASGNEAVPATAFSLNTRQESPLEPQLLLDRVIIRGNGLTGLAIDRAIIDTVIQDTLFLTGTAPAIVLNSHQTSFNVVEAGPPKPRRLIRISRATFCVRKDVFDISVENNSKPPLTSLLLQDSVCSVEGSGNAAVVFAATKWPTNTANPTGWMTNLTLLCPSTLFLGFERLMDLDKTSFKVSNIDGWQRVWGRKYDPHQFQSSFWQETMMADLSVASLQDFDSSTLPYHEIKTGTGSLPGCSVSRLNVPGMISQDRMLALSQRKNLPVLIQKPIDSNPWKKVDLSKEDLGQVINKNDWPTGTVMEVTGAGIKQMSPARISGKALRIVFRQADGAPLKLQPKSTEQKSSHESLGLFQIENGLLDIQSGTIETTQSAKSAITPWLISCRNASLILRGCQLSGPSVHETDQHLGLIQWVTSSAYRPADGIDTPFLSINDSFLMSNGNGIRVESNQGNVFMRNSIVAIRGNGINVQPDYTDFRGTPTFDLEHVTFSASKAAIYFEAGTGVETAPAPYRFYVNYCAFCAPLEFKANEGAEAAVVECIGPVRDKKQMQWWGTSNGVAKEVKTLLKQSDTSPVETSADWIAAWGDASEFRMLTGARGVVLAGGLPNKWVNVKASSFGISPNCPAATWADGERPLGADIHGVENSMMAKKTSLETKHATPNSATPSAPGSSAPKKGGVGF